ncbi:MAG TPA: pro-sigmaK processing inhibitor BofA family protein [Oscillospiraceae bacterium]|nr:pro-sigmaK processing inhibitor BofA family protein [Oscillospiraceae bacterium]
MPKIDLNLVVAAIFGLFMLYYLGKALATPARVVVRVLVTGVVGVALLFIFNLVAGLFSMKIGINAITALVVGYMGLPGLAMLVVIQTFLG